MQLQYLILASALCLSLAYPVDQHHYYEESHGGYEHLAHHEAAPIHDYGQHQIERVSLGEEHGHEIPHYEVEQHHTEDEHVDYYVSGRERWPMNNSKLTFSISLCLCLSPSLS